MSGNPELVTEVTDVMVAMLKSQPPILVVKAVGEVRTSGWTHPGLSRMVYVVEPADGIQDYEFTATPPNDPASDVISEVTAEDRWHDPAKWVKGVRGKAATNSVEKPAPESPQSAEYCQVLPNM